MSGCSGVSTVLCSTQTIESTCLTAGCLWN
jgi:hypothetical protein